MQVTNGTPATQLPMARWRKSRASNPSGCCVEVAALPDGAVAVRNSRDPAGPALVYTRAEVAAFLTGVKNGEFDDLYPGASVVLSLEAAAAASGLQRLDQRGHRPRHRPASDTVAPGCYLRLQAAGGMANLATG
jgi:nitrogen fixation-related uncharacterized protein